MMVPLLPARLLRRLVANEDGVAAVEFGALIPIFALILICTADFGLGFHTKMQVQTAAQAGAAYAISRGYNGSGITSAITGATHATSIQAEPAPQQFCGCATGTSTTVVTCGTSCPGGAPSGTYVRASARATYTTLLPYPGLPTSFDFTAQSTVRIQ